MHLLGPETGTLDTVAVGWTTLLIIGLADDVLGLPAVAVISSTGEMKKKTS